MDEDEFFHATESGGTVVSSALVLMNEIIRERYMGSEWNIYGAQASRRRQLAAGFVQVPRAAGRQDPAAGALLRLRAGGRRGPEPVGGIHPRARRQPAVRDAEDRDAGADLPGVPRPLQEEGPQAACGDERRSTPTPSDAEACAGRAERGLPSACRGRATGLRADRPVPRGDPPHRAALRARHLPEPARDHHRRADAGRLRLGRHAGELPPLVLRQGVHPEREELPRAATWAWPTRSSSTPTPASPT